MTVKTPLAERYCSIPQSLWGCRGQGRAEQGQSGGQRQHGFAGQSSRAGGQRLHGIAFGRAASAPCANAGCLHRLVPLHPARICARSVRTPPARSPRSRTPPALLLCPARPASAPRRSALALPCPACVHICIFTFVNQPFTCVHVYVYMCVCLCIQKYICICPPARMRGLNSWRICANRC